MVFLHIVAHVTAESSGSKLWVGIYASFLESMTVLEAKVTQSH